MVAARQPFLDAPANWDDPVNVSALAQAQTGDSGPGGYLRQHSYLRPLQRGRANRDYIAANIDLIGFEASTVRCSRERCGQRTGEASAKIRAACGS